MDKIFKDIEDGKNLFITGAAGVGKSYKIRQIKEKFTYFCITSSSGVSALIIGGITFHSMSGLQIGKESVERYVEKLSNNSKQLKFIKNLRGIILDECSMLSKEFFEKVDKVFRVLRKSKKPFGGIQIIICGDFYQLPPIDPGYLFESNVWYELKMENIILTEVKRQTGREFIDILSKLRKGIMDEETENFLRRFIRKADDNIIKLCPLKRQADQHNKKMLDKIDEEEKRFDVKMSSANIKLSQDKKETMFKFMSENMQAPPTIILKKTCKVLYLKNDKDKKLVNGSEGIVTGFSKTYPIVKFDKCEIVVTPHAFDCEDKEGNVYFYEQLPLLVCYAISIHKSQGMTLQKASINIGSNIFADHQAYVAISRLASSDGLYIDSFDKNSFTVDEKVTNFYKYIEASVKN